MTNVVRFALIAASIAALTSPVLARTTAKSDRMTCAEAPGFGWQCSAPVGLREGVYANERVPQLMYAPNADLRYGPQPFYPQSPPGGGY
jgi:hypothetical protein